MNVCMYIRMYVCMYVCMYVYICCVLTKPPIPSSRCEHFVNLRPKNLYFMNEDIFIIMSSPLCLLRVFAS